MEYHYILQTAPNREFAARMCLDDLGLVTTVPMEIGYSRNRGRRRRKVEIARPIMPGYVVITGTAIPWMRIWDVASVSGVVGFGGEPALLSNEVVAAIAKLRIAPKMRRAKFKIGDEVTVTNAPWTATGVVRIADLESHRARVVLELFGATREAVVDISRVRRAA